MKKINKFPDSTTLTHNLSGGVNLSMPANLIADNEMQLCENMEYDLANNLKTRGGLSDPLLTFSANILGVFYDYEMNSYIVFLTNQEIYTCNLYTKTLVGSLTGTRKPVCVKYGGKVLIASGDKLQSYDYSSLTTISDSPICDIVFERHGRVIVTKVGTDNLVYSGMGDERNWTDDPDSDSSSKFIEVGYKDGGGIVAIANFANDIMVFKSNGKVYQLSNEYPDWAIYEIAKSSDCENQYALTNLGNEVVYMSKRGLSTLSAVSEYGNIQVGLIGDKFNKAFIDNIVNPVFWLIKRKQQLIIKSNSTKNELWVYHYKSTNATKFTFSINIVDVVESPTEFVIASGASLYLWDDTYEMDIDNYIQTKLKPKKILFPYRKTFSKGTVGFESLVSNAFVQLNINKRKDVTLNYQAKKYPFFKSFLKDFYLDIELKTNYPITLEFIAFEVSG